MLITVFHYMPDGGRQSNFAACGTKSPARAGDLGGGYNLQTRPKDVHAAGAEHFDFPAAGDGRKHYLFLNVYVRPTDSSVWVCICEVCALL